MIRINGKFVELRCEKRGCPGCDKTARFYHNAVGCWEGLEKAEEAGWTKGLAQEILCPKHNPLTQESIPFPQNGKKLLKHECDKSIFSKKEE